MRGDELFEAAKQLEVPLGLLRQVHDTGRLPVVNFAAGGIATPADASLMMQLGAEGVFVGSGAFLKSGNPNEAQLSYAALRITRMQSSSPRFLRILAKRWWV